MTMAARADGSLHERLLRSAAALTVADGWSKVTMSRLADDVGVSRQSVYNEFGNKPAIARELVLTELTVFLGKVSAAFAAHRDDPVAAIHAASLDVLLLARENPLLRAIVAGSHGVESELLPLLTTDSGELLSMAKDAITEGMLRFDLPLDRGQLDVGVDVVVRTVLSHVIQPSGSPEDTAAGVAWVAKAVLDDTGG